MTDFNFDLESLDDILNSAGSVVANHAVQEVEELAERLPYLKFTQRNSGQGYPGIKNVPNEMITLRTTNNKALWEGYLFASEEIRWWPVDFLPKYIRNNGKNVPQHIGGRSLMAFSPETGQMLQGDDMTTVCRSSDGIAPHSRHIGTQVTFPKSHPKSGQVHFIGAKVVEKLDNGLYNVEMADPESICATCPLSKFNGNTKPLCNERWVAVIYLPPQKAYKFCEKQTATKIIEECEYPGGLVQLQGNPNSVQIAIQGRTIGSSGAPLDKTQEYPDYWRFTKDHGEVTVYIPKEELRPNTPAHMILGFTAAQNSKEIFDATDANYEDPNLPFVALKVLGYKWAQNGLPETVGWKAALPEMRYLTMKMLPNSWQNNNNSPQWNLAPDPVNPEHYAFFLKEKARYITEDIRRQLLNPDNLHDVKTALLTSGGSQSTKQFLPSSINSDAIEADIEELHDM